MVVHNKAAFPMRIHHRSARRVRSGWAGVALCLALGGALVAADGDLDPGFGVQGVVSDDFGSTFGYTAAALQQDGKLLIAGGLAPNSAAAPAPGQMTARYLDGGTRDAAFGSAGVAFQAGQALGSSPRGLVVQPDGTLAVIGQVQLDSAHVSTYLGRLTRDGVLDPGFGQGGTTLVGFGLPGSAVPMALARQDDGKLLVLGYDQLSRRLALARYLASGAIDTGFGSAGAVTTTIGSLGWAANALTVLPDGGIVAVGAVNTDQFNTDLALVKYRPDGSLDAAFGSAGIVQTHPGGSGSAACVASDALGRLVVGGSNAAGSFLVARYLANGALDATFGVGGIATSAPSLGSALTRVACLADGRIIAAGSALAPASGGSGFNSEFALTRWTAAGALDLSFGGGGIIVSNDPEANAGVGDMIIRSDGRIICAGSDLGPSGALLRVERRLSGAAPYISLAAGNATAGTLDLTWTAPTSPSGSGAAASYQIRVATAPITPATFASATLVAGAPLPHAPGTTEHLTVAGLAATTTYYFAYVSLDAAAHASALSRVAGATTLAGDTVAPTLAITTAGALSNAASIAFTLTFSEPVTGLSPARIAVGNATIQALTGSGAHYVLTVAPVHDDTITVSVPRGAATDAAGNPSAPAAAQVISDRTAPQLAFSPNAEVISVLAPSFVPAGIASDANGVAAVALSWSGATSGSAPVQGTTAWSAPAVTLNPGTTTFTVTARDGAGNLGQRALAVFYGGLIAAEHPATTAPGLSYEYFEGGWGVLPAFPTLTPVAVGTAAQVDLAARRRDTLYALHYHGFVAVPSDGVYTFSTTSDDGSALSLGGIALVANDGKHAAQERSASIALQAGLHAIEIGYFQNGGGATLVASFSGPGLAKQAIPAAALSHPVALATGGILREYWTGIVGRTVATLTHAPAFPLSPTGTSLQPTFAAPSNWADSYGTRMRGYVTAPITGAYTFWIAGDDQCELWLSPVSSLEEDKVLIATVPSGTAPLAWNTFPQQRSAAITLTAGRAYYIEALQKEAGGGDCLAVGWQLPDATFERPIPGNRLAPPLLGTAFLDPRP